MVRCNPPGLCQTTRGSEIPRLRGRRSALRGAPPCCAAPGLACAHQSGREYERATSHSNTRSLVVRAVRLVMPFVTRSSFGPGRTQDIRFGSEGERTPQCCKLLVGLSCWLWPGWWFRQAQLAGQRQRIPATLIGLFLAQLPCTQSRFHHASCIVSRRDRLRPRPLSRAKRCREPYY